MHHSIRRIRRQQLLIRHSRRCVRPRGPRNARTGAVLGTLSKHRARCSVTLRRRIHAALAACDAPRTTHDGVRHSTHTHLERRARRHPRPRARADVEWRPAPRWWTSRSVGQSRGASVVDASTTASSRDTATRATPRRGIGGCRRRHGHGHRHRRRGMRTYERVCDFTGAGDEDEHTVGAPRTTHDGWRAPGASGRRARGDDGDGDDWFHRGREGCGEGVTTTTTTTTTRRALRDAALAEHYGLAYEVALDGARGVERDAPGTRRTWRRSRKRVESMANVDHDIFGARERRRDAAADENARVVRDGSHSQVPTAALDRRLSCAAHMSPLQHELTRSPFVPNYGGHVPETDENLRRLARVRALERARRATTSVSPSHAAPDVDVKTLPAHNVSVYVPGCTKYHAFM